VVVCHAPPPDMIHLQSISLRQDTPLPDSFPYNVPVIRNLDTLEFSSSLTFFVGENGSGKSTLLEAIAAAASLPTVGSVDTGDDPTLNDIRKLSRLLKWSLTKRTRTGFFMRSEDFFGFSKRIAQQMAFMRQQLESDDESHDGQSAFARQMAKMPYAREYRAMKELYGDGLDAQSHGESYFKLFRSRFRPKGLYLLDEPEAPLSPNRQLTLLALLQQMIQQDAQFVIATHSPIILAYPGATIYNFTDGRIEAAKYDDLEHVSITRDFLNNPQAYLRYLLE